MAQLWLQQVSSKMATTCAERTSRSLSVSPQCHANWPFNPKYTKHANHSLQTAVYTRPQETADEALDRRFRESVEVSTRVTDVLNYQDFQERMKAAGDKLVVLEIQSDDVCSTGLSEEAESHWKVDKDLEMQPCNQIKHVFQRTARACPDVVFLSCLADTDGGSEICEELEIDMVPTLQFWRSGKMVWQHKGAVKMEENVGDGLLFYGDVAAGGVTASEFIGEIQSRADFESFVAEQPQDVLAVVYVGIQAAAPCLHIYPAVLALAKNFGGLASFSRLIGDSTPELQELMGELKVMEVPTFLFYRNGVKVGQHVGSSRGDLIGQILLQQSQAGQPVPAAPPRATVQRRR